MWTVEASVRGGPTVMGRSTIRNKTTKIRGNEGQSKEFVLDVAVQRQPVKRCEKWCHIN